MQQGRLLLVDDAARSIRLLAKMLNEDGYAVDVCYDGTSAIERLEIGPPPSMIITDLLMPGAHGLTVARTARKLNPYMPLLLITGYPELLPMALDDLTPAPLVHPKPIDYAKLRGQVRELVEL
jgi:two-component system response regulator MprA